MTTKKVTETKQVKEEIEPKAKPLLQTAAYIVPNQVTSLAPNWGIPLVDKMVVSDDYKQQLALCRFYSEKDSIVAGIISKQVDLGFNGYKLKKSECTEEEYEVYESADPLILSTLRIMAKEYLVSGLLVPEIMWKTVGGKDLGLKGRPNKTYQVPETIWLRDPVSIDLKRSPIPTDVRVYLSVPGDDIYFITNEGKYQDGTEDKELYQTLKKNYPDYVKMVKSGKTIIPLPDAFIIRRSVESGKIWPTPYLLPALESLQHKRNLKKMDYSIAARVISAIQLITLGSDKFPLTEDDQPLLDELRAQMLWRGQPNNIERVFQLFGNHTLDIKWIYPPVDVLLDDKKYAQVNHDIIFSLGVPSIIVSGEATRAGAGAEFTLLPPTEMLKALRKDLTPFILYLYEEMRKRNKFTNVAKPGFPPIRLYDPAKAAQLGETYYNNGVVSKTTWGSFIDVDYEDEQYQRRDEIKLNTELGIDVQPQVPFSSPAIPNKGPKQQNNVPNKGNTTQPTPAKKGQKPAPNASLEPFEEPESD